ncbi:MAG: prolyl oligopeptidase family serine peptidase [Chitinophagales bacterium]
MLNLNDSVPFNPPVTPSQPIIDELHGTRLTDCYQWLEDKNDETVIEWTADQHDATLDYLDANCPPIEGLEEELEAYINRDITSSVFFRGDKQFFYRRKKGEAQHTLFTIIEGKEKVLFDPTSIDPEGQTAILSLSINHQNDTIAIGCQTKGAEIQTCYVLDIETGKQLFDPIPNLRGFNWCRDGKHAYITKGSMEMLEKQIPLRTYRHQLGRPHSEDIFLIAPKDAKDFTSIWDAKHSDVSFISEADFNSNTIRMLPFRNSAEQASIELFSSKESQAHPNAIGDNIYFFTNHEAPNFKLMVADKSQATFEHWRELIDEKADIVLQGYQVTKDFIITQEKKDVLSRLFVYSKEGKLLKELPLPIEGNVSSLGYHHYSNTVFVHISSFTNPAIIYKLDGSTLEWTFFHQQETPMDMSNIESKLVFYPSKDGTKVPLFLVHQKDLQLDGNNPVRLTAYGGFNVGRYPVFVGAYAPFINRGGIFALACIRGGDEYGENWHKDGMQFKKQNCFDDFIAASEYLIEQQYTNTKKLAIEGGSNGGLLIGAVITQRPDLFQAAICSVPLLDMIRYHKFLIARYWIPEYGDPDIEADFRYLLSYSPYHNIRMGVNLPTTLFKAGENDTRVDPLHAKKMVAALQNNTGQINPIMLYIDYDSGHGSGKSVQQTIDDLDYEMRFLMRTLEMEV